MNKCSCCGKQKELENFIKGNKTLKTCIECRDACKKWKDKNKERVKLNNKMSSDNRQNKKETYKIICGRKKGEEEWIEYKSQVDAAEKLKLQKSNISKVIKGDLNITGGYEFKIIEKKFQKIEVKTWEEIKEENNFQHKQKGQPAPHRIKHEERENVMGKCCCKCKEWKPLTDYFNANNHWDNLRNDCKTCIYEYKNNRSKTDPEFKLISTLRSRLYSALKSKNAKKCDKTLELTGCSISFLKGYLEAKFTEDMSWEKLGIHGIHIDHIIPCAKFNLLIEDEQRKCFHYTNLQPLWAKDNLSKGAKF